MTNTILQREIKSAFTCSVQLLKSSNKFIKGSDEHLDMVIAYQKRISKLSDTIEKICEDIEPRLSNESTNNILPFVLGELKKLYLSSTKFKTQALKSVCGDDIQNSIDRLNDALNNLNEAIMDIELIFNQAPKNKKIIGFLGKFKNF